MPTILVVDDEPLVRRMVAHILENEGFLVLTAESGEEAIEISHSHKGALDLLVSDIRMPVMDGCTLAQQLQEENPDLPVLLISGYCEDEPEMRCPKFPVLSKPFSMKSLVATVRTLLGQPVAA